WVFKQTVERVAWVGWAVLLDLVAASAAWVVVSAA
ncbi:MAG: hypothetical protein OXFUSZZB_000511, partial [Candidatus Fervidibacter sp.]